MGAPRCLEFHVDRQNHKFVFLTLSKAFGDIVHIASRCRSDLGALFPPGYNGFECFENHKRARDGFVTPARSTLAA